MRELLRTTDPTLVAFVTAMLRGEGIDCFPVDVHMSVLEGSVGVLPRRVLVRAEEIRENEKKIFGWVASGETVKEITDKGGYF